MKPRVEVRVALDFLDSPGTDDGSPAKDGSRGHSSHHSGLPHNYITEPHHRIEIYRKLAQAGEKPLLDALQKELRDRFGPLAAAGGIVASRRRIQKSWPAKRR